MAASVKSQISSLRLQVSRLGIALPLVFPFVVTVFFVYGVFLALVVGHSGPASVTGTRDSGGSAVLPGGMW